VLTGLRRATVTLGALPGLITPEMRQAIGSALEALRGDRELLGAEHVADRVGQMAGFFIVDRQGTVRFARTGLGVSLVPSNPEIVRLLDELSG